MAARETPLADLPVMAPAAADAPLPADPLGAAIREANTAMIAMGLSHLQKGHVIHVERTVAYALLAKKAINQALKMALRQLEEAKR